MPNCTAGPWGTVWLSDNANRVEGTVSLVDSGQIRDVWLNFSDSFFDEHGDLLFTMLAYIGAGTPFEIHASKDGETADGYAGHYDLDVPIQANDVLTTLTFTLCSGIPKQGSNDAFCNDSVDLNVAHFDLLDELGITHVTVQRNGASGDQDPVPNFLTDTNPLAAPEPGSLVLVATGLAVAARRFRHRR
jgi:hypothetical protein